MFRGILSTIMFLASGIASAEYSCNVRAESATELLQVFNEKQVDVSSVALQAVNEARAHLEAGSFCESLFTNIELCVSLAAAHQMGWVKAKNPADQKVVNRALWEYGNLFHEEYPDRFGGCNLKLIEAERS